MPINHRHRCRYRVTRVHINRDDANKRADEYQFHWIISEERQNQVYSTHESDIVLLFSQKLQANRIE